MKNVDEVPKHCLITKHFNYKEPVFTKRLLNAKALRIIIKYGLPKDNRVPNY